MNNWISFIVGLIVGGFIMGSIYITTIETVVGPGFLERVLEDLEKDEYR